MKPSQFRRPFDSLTRIGFCLLIVASILNYLVAHQLVIQNDYTDFAVGLLYGLCIASILIGIRRRSRQRSDGSCGVK